LGLSLSDCAAAAAAAANKGLADESLVQDTAAAACQSVFAVLSAGAWV